MKLTMLTGVSGDGRGRRAKRAKYGGNAGSGNQKRCGAERLESESNFI